MKPMDHLDLVITVGLCATVLGAGLFLVVLGGGFNALIGPQETAALDTHGVIQRTLADAVMRAGEIRYLTESQTGPAQESLGNAIVAAARGQLASRDVMPNLMSAGRQSGLRLSEMIQERTGHAIVMATQQILRSGAGESGQARETRLRETLGRIAGAASAIERAARIQQQEALGWLVVGTLRAMEDYAGQLQMRLGSAIRNAGVLEARVETEMPRAQESLGSAIVVATRSALAEASELTARVASVEGGSVPHGTQEIPYQAGGILLAGLFVIFWGLRAVAESGTTLPRMGTASAVEERYRKVG